MQLDIDAFKTVTLTDKCLLNKARLRLKRMTSIMDWSKNINKVCSALRACACAWIHDTFIKTPLFEQQWRYGGGNYKFQAMLFELIGYTVAIRICITYITHAIFILISLIRV
jgi:hypothetical protein